jgi:hypothetical protein
MTLMNPPQMAGVFALANQPQKPVKAAQHSNAVSTPKTDPPQVESGFFSAAQVFDRLVTNCHQIRTGARQLENLPTAKTGRSGSPPEQGPATPGHQWQQHPD